MYKPLLSLVSIVALSASAAFVFAAGQNDRATAIASPKIGSQAPNFDLKGPQGKMYHLSDFKGKVVVLEWTNPDCPFVKRLHQAREFTNLYNKYHKQGVVWLAINSSEGSNPDVNQAFVELHHIPYPVLDDRTGKVGKEYGAKTTPDMFILNKDGKIVYEGAIDNDPEGAKSGDKINYVDKALTELLAGKPVSTPQTRSYGCHVAYAQ